MYINEQIKHIFALIHWLFYCFINCCQLVWQVPWREAAGDADSCTLTASSVYQTQQAGGSAACSCSHRSAAQSSCSSHPQHQALSFLLHISFITPLYLLAQTPSTIFAPLSGLFCLPTSAAGVREHTKDQKQLCRVMEVKAGKAPSNGAKCEGRSVQEWSGDGDCGVRGEPG